MKKRTKILILSLMIVLLGVTGYLNIVLNNSAHDSVGGQPTVGGAIDFEEIARLLGYNVLQSPQSQYAYCQFNYRYDF